MKYLLLLFVLPIVGCSLGRPSEASYVRSHKCVPEIKIPDFTGYTQEYGLQTSPGWTSYKCPDGTYVNINNNEAQP